MASSVVMPALEMAQETGKIISWLKKEGDSITKGQPLLEVETDKAVVEIEATADGILAGVLSKEGDVVPVGKTIAWIVAPGEKPPAETGGAVQTGRTMSAASTAAVSNPSTAAKPAAPAADAAPSGGPQISPKARRLAKEHGVDITRVKGTGPNGTISSEDILAAAAAGPAAAPASAAAAGVEPLTGIARLMAERTTQSWTQAPHFFLVRDIDAGALNEAREKLGPAIERDSQIRGPWTGPDSGWP